jgi:hypothetical protein
MASTLGYNPLSITVILVGDWIAFSLESGGTLILPVIGTALGYATATVLGIYVGVLVFLIELLSKKKFISSILRAGLAFIALALPGPAAGTLAAANQFLRK